MQLRLHHLELVDALGRVLALVIGRFLHPLLERRKRAPDIGCERA